MYNELKKNAGGMKKHARCTQQAGSKINQMNIEKKVLERIGHVLKMDTIMGPQAAVLHLLL